MDENPRLLRRAIRRPLRRIVFLCALVAIVVIAPAAAGTAALDVQVTVIGTPGSNGWYRGNVTVSWTYSGAERTEGCNASTLTADTPGTKLTCSAWNDTEGSFVSKSVTIKLDRTVPSVTATADRLPDANGWYNRALTVGYSGTDATSQIASCSAASRYAGPDNPAAAVSGSCTDVAGNTASASVSFKYDATAPTLFAVTARLGNRSAQVAWRKSMDTELVEVLRAPGRGGQGETIVYRGSATGFRDTGLGVGRKYEYRVAGIDDAANRAEKALDIVATGPLLSPVPGAKITGPTTLVWTPVKRASYYNLQLIRGRKVLSAWPARPGFRLRRTWTYEGRRYRLRPGVYRWYVWPGYGRISASHYGRLLGSSTFVVTK